VITYQQVIAHVGLVASILLRTLQVVCVLLVAAAVATFVGFAIADDWQQSGLVLGAVLGGAVAVAAVIEVRFTQDVARAKRLPEISREEWAGAARQVAGRAASSERSIVAAKGRGRLWHFVKGLWALKADIDTLADGGLAPAASLGRAVVPSRLLTVAVIAVAAPFLLAFGLLVLVLAISLG
jgi:hypothetical protein